MYHKVYTLYRLNFWRVFKSQPSRVFLRQIEVSARHGERSEPPLHTLLVACNANFLCAT